jgi:hypothetical protein
MSELAPGLIIDNIPNCTPPDLRVIRGSVLQDYSQTLITDSILGTMRQSPMFDTAVFTDEQFSMRRSHHTQELIDAAALQNDVCPICDWDLNKPCRDKENAPKRGRDRFVAFTGWVPRPVVCAACWNWLAAGSTISKATACDSMANLRPYRASRIGQREHETLWEAVAKEEVDNCAIREEEVVHRPDGMTCRKYYKNARSARPPWSRMKL